LFQVTTRRVLNKLDILQKMLEKITKNQEKMQDEMKSIKEEVAILSYDQGCVDVSKILNFEIFRKYS
jgi:hypothetical protein